MNDVCINLNFNISPLKSNIDLKDYTLHGHYKLSYDDLHTDLIDLLSRLNLKVVLVELFYTRPLQHTRAHIDIAGGDYTKLNWQFGGELSLMQWYREIKHGEKKRMTTAIGTGYIGFDSDEVELLSEHPVGFPSIVQVGIPHSIINHNKPRHVISVVYKDINTNLRLTMSESIQRFRSYLSP